MPDLDAQLMQGDTSAATGWLRTQVQQHDGLYAPADLIAQASGQAPSAAPLLAYLTDKFTTLYDL